MTDPWSWWADKLAGKPVQMNPGNPHAGFYRMPRKAFYGARKTFTPVAYWPGTNGKGEPVMHCRFGDDDVTPERGEEIWERVGNHPVSEQAYRAVAQDNKPWPDEHKLVPMGDNLPPEDEDTYESLKDKIENLGHEAKRRLDDGPPITDQDEANQIANLADRLAELWKRADTLRKAERKPHDETLKTIQKKWSGILLLAESYRNLKYGLLTPWLKRVGQAQKEQAEAAEAAGTPAAAEPSRPRAGTRGRAMSLKTLKRAEIADYDEALKFFAQNPEIKQLVQDLANRWVRTGQAVPGTKVIEEQSAV
jgi:hypothetical protein